MTMSHCWPTPITIFIEDVAKYAKPKFVDLLLAFVKVYVNFGKLKKKTTTKVSRNLQHLNI